MTTIELYKGDRRELLPLFALADESLSEISTYITRGEVLVARDDGVIIGHAQLVAADEPEASELKSLAVQETRRRGGVGAALVGAAASRSRAGGMRRLLVSTATADVDNLRFYQRLGFRMLRIVRDAFTRPRGYAEGALVRGVPLRDQLWLELDLQTRPARPECGDAAEPGEHWETRHDLTPDEIDHLEEELYRFNAERTGHRDAQGLGFFVRRGDRLVGAIAGYTWGGVCELRQVWVREGARRQGLGRELLETAISEARRRGCAHVILATHDFQAPDFYKRFGFDLVAEVPDKPVGHTEFIFRRKLAN